LDDATSALGGIAPFHWFDFINNRALYAGVDVGNVTGGTGYSFARASVGTYENLDGTISSFSSGQLRRGTRGVLMEGAATNLCLNSEDMTVWSALNGGSTDTANAIAAPDGTMTADLLDDTDAAAVRGRFRGATVPNDSNPWTGSVYAKTGTSSIISVRVTFSGGTGTNHSVVVDLSNGNAQWQTGSVGTSFRVRALANGWYRIAVTATNNGTGNTAFNMELRPAFAATYTPTVSAAATGSAYFWGGQIESGPTETSYIPTAGSSVARNADVLTFTQGVSYPLSLWAEVERVADTNLFQRYFQMDDGTTANHVALILNTSELAEAAVRRADAGEAASAVAGAVAVPSSFKHAGRFETNNVIGCRNGTLSTVDTSVTLPTTTLMRVGANVAGAGSFTGYIRRVAVFNSALSNAQLQTITSEPVAPGSMLPLLLLMSGGLPLFNAGLGLVNG
jgi:hypothetical protein